MNNKCIMLQGTGSSVGKSLLATALCRIFKQDGYSVIPFKAQNMALNSFVTVDGQEMGRAQVVQAEACGLLPSALMNPILLKPTGDRSSQVIVNGRVYKNMTATEYYKVKPELRKLVLESYEKLEETKDLVVIEGAGSPAEINLRDGDFVNMGMAEMADAPVILIGDIDRGGVFASLYGTIMLLKEEERKRVKGVIINKFRGDVELLKPGLKMLEDLIKIPVIGVVPYMELNIDDEDSVTEEFSHSGYKRRDVEVAVIKLPYISNFTDFQVFRFFEDVSLRYINPNINFGEPWGEPDILIIPGSKHTLSDLKYLKESGLDKKIYRHVQQGRLLLGICGGYQMLGKELSDPYCVESGLGRMEGLGLLNMSTVFEKEKVATQVVAQVTGEEFWWGDGLENERIEGYEIHMGVSTHGSDDKPVSVITSRWGKNTRVVDGVADPSGNVLGTYIHGIFDNTSFTRKLLNNIRKQKGLPLISHVPESLKQLKEKEYDKLAGRVRECLDIDWIHQNVLGNDKVKN